MLDELMLAPGLSGRQEVAEQVLVIDTLPLLSDKKVATGFRDKFLTDESFSEYSDCDESSLCKGDSRELDSPNYQRQGFLPLKAIPIEVEDSHSMTSNDKSIEQFKPKVLLLSTSPHPSKSEDEPKSGLLIKGDSSKGFDSKPNPSEKKVPHAPRNLNKINFNFDKGFLADRSEKKAQSLVTQSLGPALLEDQLATKMSSLKFKNRNLKLNDVELSSLTPPEQVQMPGAVATVSQKSTKYESSLEEKLKIKDILILELRAEVEALNFKNRSLITEVAEQRETISKLEAQLEHAYKSNLELRMFDPKLKGQLKVSIAVNRRERWMPESVSPKSRASPAQILRF